MNDSTLDNNNFKDDIEQPRTDNSELIADIKNVDACVICSTLNQMVNYLPIKQFGFEKEKIYNLTIQGASYIGENNRWDEYLFDNTLKYKLDNSHILKFQQNEITNIDLIKKKLKTSPLANCHQIFWNITGGQRSLILAIYEFIKENSSRTNDYICYLEGNTNQLVILRNGIKLINNFQYTQDDLTIETALNLAGFQCKENVNTLRDCPAIYYDEFLQKYRDNKEIRNLLLKTNQNNNSTNDVIQELNKIINDKTLQTNILPDLQRNKAFGYLLEKMAAYQIFKVTENIRADLVFNQNINYTHDGLRIDESSIDEFDIVLLTKNGKLIIFECKSGLMNTNQARSHKYSVYAASGVYGKPILISPLTSTEIKNPLNTLSGDYNNIKSAIGAAKRANLEVWGIDEIEPKLKELLK